MVALVVPLLVQGQLGASRVKLLVRVHVHPVKVVGRLRRFPPVGRHEPAGTCSHRLGRGAPITWRLTEPMGPSTCRAVHVEERGDAVRAWQEPPPHHVHGNGTERRPMSDTVVGHGTWDRNNR